MAREARGWTLAELGDRLGMSVPHVKSLESGVYSFGAPLLSSLAHTFGEPIARFVGPDPRPTGAREEWGTLFDAVSERDRTLLLDMARRFGELTDTTSGGGGAARLIALEGIDGALLRLVGQRLSSLLDAEHCDHDYDNELWRYMMRHLEAKSSGTPDRRAAFQRTLLFACERVHRQEDRVRTALSEGRSAVIPFSAMASSVYQEAEGVGDRKLIDILETLILKPDVILIVHSSPVEATRKAVLRRPENEDEFYSAFQRPEDFARAQELYQERVADEFAARGYCVRKVDAGSNMNDQLIAAVLQQLLDIVPAAKAALAKLSRTPEKANGARLPVPKVAKKQKPRPPSHRPPSSA